jgi:hypothetical protein
MKKTPLILVVLTCYAILPPSTTLASVCEAVDTHIEWRGGDRFTSLKYLELIGQIHTSGLEGSARQAVRRDGYLLFEYDIQAFSGAEALTPDDSWEQSLSGQVGDLGKAEIESTKRTIDETFGMSLLGQGSGKVSCLDDEEKDGTLYQVVRVAFKDGSWFDYLIDPASGALPWSRSQRDGNITWYRNSNWKVVNGVRFAFSLEIIEENPGSNTTLIWDKISFDKEIAADDFARPVGLKSLLQFTDAESTTGWMDFKFFKSRRIFIDGLINGHKTEIILDSGAEVTAIDSTFAKSIGLEGEGDLTATGVSGSTQAQVVNNVSIQIGNLLATNLTVVVIDLSYISDAIGHPISVIFGEEVFNEFVVDIDYPNERIAFTSPAAFSAQGLGPGIAIVSAQGGQKEIPVSVNGLPDALVGLDTGSGDTITFFKHWTDRNQILDGLKTSTNMSGGVGGQSVNLIGTVASIKIGDHVLTNVPVSFSQSEEGAYATAEIAGNMGVQIFRQFRTTFHFGAKRLWLSTEAASFKPEFDRNRSGLRTVKEGDAIRVTYVSQGSPADKSGWKIGENIIAIDGAPIGSDYWTKQYGWNMKPAGTKIEFQTTDGRLRSLVLEDYY